MTKLRMVEDYYYEQIHEPNPIIGSASKIRYKKVLKQKLQMLDENNNWIDVPVVKGENIGSISDEVANNKKIY